MALGWPLSVLALVLIAFAGCATASSQIDDIHGRHRTGGATFADPTDAGLARERRLRGSPLRSQPADSDEEEEDEEEHEDEDDDDEGDHDDGQSSSSPGASCVASSLEVAGVRFTCSTSVLGGGATLHWVLRQGSPRKVDLALVKVGTGGYLSLGFPSSAGRMVGAHASVATGTGAALVNLDSYSAPFPSLALSSMRVQIAGASSSTQGGNKVLQITGLVLGSTPVNFVFAKADSCTWPCMHSRFSGATLDFLAMNSTSGGQVSPGEGQGTPVPSPSPSPAPGASCTGSSLEVGGVRFNCSTSVMGGRATLHWVVQNASAGKVDLALVKPGQGGWLSLGFPAQPGKMVGAHAAVASGTVAALVNVNSYASPFPALTSNGMRVQIAGASTSAQGGDMVLLMTGVMLSLTHVDFVFAYTDACTWPCMHSSFSGATFDFSAGGSNTAGGGHGQNQDGESDQESDEESDDDDDEHTGPSPSPSPVAGASCTGSSLEVGGVRFNCSTSVMGGRATLHWVVQNASAGKVDLALVKPGQGGWLSLGFPAQPGKMVGAHAAVASGTVAALVNVNSYSAPFPALTSNDMRVQIAGASTSAQGGDMVLLMTGVSINLTRVDFVFAYADACTWPCMHSSFSGATFDFSAGGSNAVGGGQGPNQEGESDEESDDNDDDEHTGPSPSPSPVAGDACTGSSLEVGGVRFNCSTSVMGGRATLYWVVQNASAGKVDLALVKPGQGGWLSLGFPAQPGKMVGAHAAVASGTVAALVNVNSYAAPFPALTSNDMRVQIAGASTTAQGGDMVLLMTGVSINLTHVDFVFAYADACTWPCMHSSFSGATFDFSASGGVSGGNGEQSSTTSSPPSFVANATYEVSTLEVEGVHFNYSTSLMGGGATLHWVTQDVVAGSRRLQQAGPLQQVDLAIVSPGNGGYVSLGFPEKPGKMVGAHAVVATVNGAAIVSLDDYSAPFPSLALSDMRVQIAGASVSMQDGNKVLLITGLVLGLAPVDFVFAKADSCAWPCKHSGFTGATYDFPAMNETGGGKIGPGSGEMILVPSPTPSPVPGASCTGSSLEVGGIRFNCSTSVMGGRATLHWVVQTAGKVDLALVKKGQSGWLSLGFPAQPGKMVGAHVAVASGAVASLVDVNSYAAPFPELTLDGMRVQIAGASSSTQGGDTVLLMTGAVLNLASVDFVFASADMCAWPCMHSSFSGETLDLLDASAGSTLTGWDVKELPPPITPTKAGACTPSTLKVDGVQYSCSQSVLGGHATMHWVVQNAASGDVDIAIVKPGAGGWLSVGFPEVPGRMVGAHAVVATSAGTHNVNMLSYAAPFPEVRSFDMRQPIAGSLASVEGGDLVLMVLGAVVDLNNVDLIFAYADSCAWPCMHAGSSALSFGFAGGETKDAMLAAALPALATQSPTSRAPPTSSRPEIIPSLVAAMVASLVTWSM